MRVPFSRARRALANVRLTVVVAMFALLGTIPDSASAQTARPCLPYDSTAAALSRFAVTIVRDTSAGARRFRTEYGIPVGTTADVAVVQDAAVCEAATASIEARGAPLQTDAFIVVRMGQGPAFYLTTPGGALRMASIYLLNGQFAAVVAFGP
jgi:hypothetical protein